ncbi:MAG: hypothetical protein QUV19_08735 [Alteromonas macleodii]|jgi:hypothetical protein|nr:MULTISPECIES: hypothetical protein [Gammaproteobacteria]MBU34633.1 hypothetical protein [Alteromonas sp.]AFT74835.1 hypothetical protein AMEC673_10715 [Alteromonas macleodii str. 'English Channel 673']MBL3809808.1 hypothetical protein [Alteromonas macleodii]MBL3883345.1 hypothetical protein [Alteromonas macleodii]MDM7962067.1 hypothetical protein [Alteromonas macleodii]|tara:strand:- start:49 stop:399 length:351 start_codon:yes stop_codon:yes gene_type:complete
MSIKTARYPFIGLSILFFILLIQNPLLEAIYNTLYITYFVFSFLFFMSLALGQYTKVAVQKSKLMVLFPVYSVLFVIYWLSQNWHQGRVNFILATPIVCGLLLAFMLKIQLRFLGK